jgi:hypothetical protein
MEALKDGHEFHIHCVCSPGGAGKRVKDRKEERGKKGLSGLDVRRRERW